MQFPISRWQANTYGQRHHVQQCMHVSMALQLHVHYYNFSNIYQIILSANHKLEAKMQTVHFYCIFIVLGKVKR